MSLAAQQDPPKIAYHARGCQLGRWVATLGAEDQAAIQAMFDARNEQGGRVWTNKAIAARITDDPDYPGVKFGADAVAYHRNRDCGCEANR